MCGGVERCVEDEGMSVENVGGGLFIGEMRGVEEGKIQNSKFSG